MVYTRCLSLPVILSLTLISFVFYTALFLLISPLYTFSTAPGLLHLACFLLYLPMVLHAYFISLFRDPGAVPPHYIPQTSAHPHPHSHSHSHPGPPGSTAPHSASAHGRSHDGTYGSGSISSSSNGMMGGYGSSTATGTDAVGLGGSAGMSLTTGDALDSLSLSISPSPSSSSLVVLEVKRKGGTPRFCGKCGGYKPARSHHCRVCKRCVLRMDHHCVWINNCVGHCNYKPFLLFLLFSIASLLHTLALLLIYYYHVASSPPAGSTAESSLSASSLTSWIAPSPSTAHVLRVLCATISLPLVCALLTLFLWHLYLVSVNKTTIEHYEGVRARLLASSRPSPLAGSSPLRHPYDLGLYNNCYKIMGPNPATWLCPWDTSHIGSGLRFPTLLD